ncbi:MAG: riboflavin synthase [Acidimicrobiia bacterium]
MFTGIVEAMGVVVDVTGADGDRRFVIEAPRLTEGLRIGDSISVQGACLTATTVSDTRFGVDLVAETLSRTTLGSVQSGELVNLERAMSADGRFGGHIVQGHVDDVGTVRRITAAGGGRRIEISCPVSILRYVVEKGSITVNGVSLTVASVDLDGFEVALIPHTLEVTTLGQLSESAPVNLEVDILAKYVERLMESRN